MSFEGRIEDLNLRLLPAPGSGGIYQPVRIVDGCAYVSGHGPLCEDESYIIGKVGVDLGVAEAHAAARQTGLAILSSLKSTLGTLDKVDCLIKSFGMVNSSPEFSDHPQVINGYSELMVEVFGQEKGVGARSAVGMGSLPNNMAVEIEAVFKVLTD